MTCNICNQKPMNCDCTSLEKSQREEIERLQLTNAERDAIEFFAAIDSNDDTLGGYSATLRNLLERMK